jgi:dCMP deaminase
MIKTWYKETGMERISWDNYFMKMAFLAAERSTCRRRHVGAVLVKDNHVLATGYNGACSGLPDCLELGCLRDEKGIPSGTQHEICRAVHAEQNAVIQAALHGVGIRGATMYCTHSPCTLCTKILINAKIARHVAAITYSEREFEEMYKLAGIEYRDLRED